MSNVEELNKIKEQNKIRAKRHYDLNKEKVAERRKIARNKCKELLNMLGIEDTNEPVSEIVEEIKEAIQEQIPLVPIKSKAPKKATIITLTKEEEKINKMVSCFLIEVWFLQQTLMDVRDYATSSDCGFDQLIKFVIAFYGKLQMPGCNSLTLQVFAAIASKFKDLRTQVFKYGCLKNC